MRSKASLMLAVVVGLIFFRVGMAQDWPDLTILDNYPNQFGGTCGVEGNPTASSEKKAKNKLKNRFEMPSDVEPVPFADIIALPPGEDESAPDVDDTNQKRGISVVGYVRGVYPGGTKGESCNCKAKGKGQVDTHIDLVLFPREDENDPDGRGVLVVEVTERSRRLAELGLLPSNIGSNWSRSILKDRLRGRWVKFTGWLFYDDDHHTGSWSVDPDDNEGENNWRATCWEVHPVLGIEVLPGRPEDIPRSRPR